MSAISWLGMFVLALTLAAIAGAITGTRIGGAFLGKELAAMMGAVFGVSPVIPAAVVGLLLLAWLK